MPSLLADRTKLRLVATTRALVDQAKNTSAVAVAYDLSRHLYRGAIKPLRTLRTITESRSPVLRGVSTSPEIDSILNGTIRSSRGSCRNRSSYCSKYPYVPPSAANHARYFPASLNDLRVVTNVDHNVHTILDPRRIAIVHQIASPQICGVKAALTEQRRSDIKIQRVCRARHASAGRRDWGGAAIPIEAEFLQHSFRKLDLHNAQCQAANIRSNWVFIAPPMLHALLSRPLARPSYPS